jgi:hypothetical protein
LSSDFPVFFARRASHVRVEKQLTPCAAPRSFSLARRRIRLPVASGGDVAMRHRDNNGAHEHVVKIRIQFMA